MNFLKLLLVSPLVALDCYAQAQLTIMGQPDVTVTKKQVLLSDIASVQTVGGQFENEAQELRNLVITEAPQAGQSQIVRGQFIVERLQLLGVKLNTVLYSFPQEVRIQRAGRKPSNEELYAATENFLQLQNAEYELNAVSASPKTKIFTDEVTYRGVRSRSIRPGILEVTLLATNSNNEEMTIPVQASVNEWREIPIASRPIKRGTVIDGADVAHARVNMAELNGVHEALSDLMSLVGMVAGRDIPAGDSFRSTSLLVPAVIEQGGKVIIIVRSGQLEARAEGIAMENGNRGQMIKVKNVSSNKIVQATVKQQGEVEVNL